MTTGTGFVSIGFALTTFFGGIFEGNGKNISNIMINNTERNVRDGGEGLFGVTYNNAKVMNLTISGDINGGGQRTGGIVGYSRKNTQIINCRNKCNIKSKHSMGGITGSVEGTSKIINSCNMAYLELIESTNTYVSVGGIAGFLNNNYVINCYNQGNIKNNSKRVYAGAGGIIGSSGPNTANIYNCYNTGKVSGENTEGSILGAYWYSNWISIIKNCYYLKGCSKYVIGKAVTTQEFDATECTSQEMKSTEIVNKLNEYVTTYNEENKDNEDFVKLKYWKAGDNGYPTFID